MIFGDCQEYYYSVIDVCRHRAVTENVLKNHQERVCVGDLGKTTALATSMAFSATRSFHHLDTLKPNGEEGTMFYALRNNNLRIAFTQSRGFIPTHEIKRTLLNESRVHQLDTNRAEPAYLNKIVTEIHREKMNYLDGLSYRSMDALMEDFVKNLKQIYNAQAETVFYDLQQIAESIASSSHKAGTTLPHPGLESCTLAKFKDGEISLDSITKRVNLDQTEVVDFFITDRNHGTYNLSVGIGLDKTATVTVNDQKVQSLSIPPTMSFESLNDSIDISGNYRKSVKDFFAAGAEHCAKPVQVDALNKATMRLAKDYSARCTPEMMAEYGMEFYYHNFKDLLKGSDNDVKRREKLIIDYMLLKGPNLMVAHNLRDFFDDKRTVALRNPMLNGLIKMNVDLPKIAAQYAAENKFSEYTTTALAEIEAQCLALKLTNALEDEMSNINYDTPRPSKSRNDQCWLTVSL